MQRAPRRGRPRTDQRKRFPVPGSFVVWSFENDRVHGNKRASSEKAALGFLKVDDVRTPGPDDERHIERQSALWRDLGPGRRGRQNPVDGRWTVLLGRAVALDEHRPDAVVSDFADPRAFTETINAIVSP